ncbi:MAG: hypothetical protein HYR55_18105 [Acidobacteria bacterium]|nr:hypothetical protein [Acidobacteriota bacterium]MBI3658504.1 hypothetical protein [Acidobacteriota bacterium]
MHNITGVRGLIARGFRPPNHPGTPPTPTPLFDEDGNPLPRVKENTWRADNSRDRSHTGYLWKDNASKDQYSGYMFALGVIYDVVADDPTIPQDKKDALIDDARGVGEHLISNDLRVVDADGRRTTFGDLCAEEPLGLPINAFNAVLSLAFIKIAYHITGDQSFGDYYSNILVDEKKYPELVRDLLILNFFQRTNFNNYNMAFMAIYNLIRLESAPNLKAMYQRALEQRLWTDFTRFKMVKEQKNFFWTMIYLSQKAVGFDPEDPEDRPAMDKAIESLLLFHPAPLWDREVINSPDYCECWAIWCPRERRKDCINDRGNRVQALTPLPMDRRPLGSFTANHNPYRLDDGANGTLEYSGVGFRLAYWMRQYLFIEGQKQQTFLRPSKDIEDTSAMHEIWVDPGYAILVEVLEKGEDESEE